MQKQRIAIVFMILASTATVKADFFGKWWEFNKRNWQALTNQQSQSTTTQNAKKSEIGLNDLKGSRSPAFNDLADILLNREERKTQGIDLPKGILLYGPAGVGKTSYLRALAHDSGMNYIEKSASDFEEVFVGLGASRIRELFAEARRKQPCMIIIDEIDAIGNRDSLYEGTLSRQLIDALLAEMDGIHTSGEIIVAATTNNINLVDKALRRPGRFDYVIEITLPDEQARKEILISYLDKKPHAAAISVDIIAQLTRGFSGAELEQLVKRAVISSVKNRRPHIVQEDLEHSLQQLLQEKAARR